MSELEVRQTCADFNGHIVEVEHIVSTLFLDHPRRLTIPRHFNSKSILTPVIGLTFLNSMSASSDAGVAINAHFSAASRHIMVLEAIDQL